MTEPLKYTMTTESIMVIHGGKPYTVKESSPNFNSLRSAIQNKEWDKVPSLLTVKGSISQWSSDRFKIGDNDTVTYDGQAVPFEFGRRIIAMATAGEDPTPLYRFYARLQKNPSKRSVDQLWPFLSKLGIPLTKDGCFLAYKGVAENFMDKHTGTICNKPGSTIKLPRNSISDDPREACHFGLHVGAKRYASGFGETVVICAVDPENVVCVPYDHSNEKMRVCEYKVIGVEGCELPSTVYDDDSLEESDEDKVAVVVKTSVKSEEKGKPEATIEVKERAAKKEYAKYNKLDSKELLDMSLDDLRKYATYGLSIVRASKVPGGKTALVKKIIKARR